MKLALHDEEGKVKDVVLVIGVTDYDELFAGVRKEGLQGISEAKVLRFSANELGKVCTFYKVCNSQDGWFPKPIEDTHCFFEMQELFRSLHPETDGIVTSIDINGMDSIERQSTRARRYNNDIICLFFYHICYFYVLLFNFVIETFYVGLQISLNVS